MERQLPRKRTVVSPEMEARMWELWDEGFSVYRIAQKLCVSYATVRRKLDHAWGEKLYELNKSWRERNRPSSRAKREQTMQKAPELRWSSFTSLFFGDPAVGRSALDRRALAGATKHQFSSFGLDSFLSAPDATEHNYSTFGEGATCNGKERA